MWQVVVPLKHRRRAKSRLARPDRDDLVIAFAHDVLAAASATPQVAAVRVVADDSWVGVLPEGILRTPDPRAGLDAALASALAVLPGDTATAVILGDLPCLTAADLQGLLDSAPAAGRWAAVPDTEGTGTTMLLGRRDALRPHFGDDSLARHRAAGATVVWQAPPAARCDVDDDQGLRAARLLGVGPATAAALARAAPQARE